MLTSLIVHHLPWLLGALTLVALAIACLFRVSVRGVAVVLIATILYVLFT